MSITVAIMSYRYGHLVAHAIESVLSQDTKPDKILVVDDGVGDCRHVPKLYPQVEFVERERNYGIVANFQDVLFSVDTDRLMMLGADNWLMPDCLRWCSAWADHDIVSYDLYITGSEAKVFAEHVNAVKSGGVYVWRWDRWDQDDIEKKNYIHGSSLYNVALARRAGGYRHSGNEHTEEDWMLWKAMLSLGASHQHIAMPLMCYRKHTYNFNGN